VVGGQVDGLFGLTNRITASSSSLLSQDRLSTPPLQLSSEHAEILCNKLSRCSSQIDELQAARAKLDQQLQTHRQLKATVSFWLISTLRGGSFS